MTEQTYAREVDPRLADAIDQPGAASYHRLLLGLAGKQQIDPDTAEKIFWQLLGSLSAEAAARRARPWIYLSVLLLVGVFVLSAALYNTLFLLALGLI
jgi:hypothetical protein